MLTQAEQRASEATAALAAAKRRAEAADSELEAADSLAEARAREVGGTLFAWIFCFATFKCAAPSGPSPN